MRRRDIHQVFWKKRKNTFMFLVFFLSMWLFGIGNAAFSGFELSLAGKILFYSTALGTFLYGRIVLQESWISSIFVGVVGMTIFFLVTLMMLGFAVLTTTIMGETGDVFSMLLER